MVSSSSVNLLPGARFSPSVLLLPASGSAALLLSEHLTRSELSSEGFATDMVTGR